MASEPTLHVRCPALSVVEQVFGFHVPQGLLLSWELGTASVRVSTLYSKWLCLSFL